jgi:hypothetical protein
MSCIPALLTTMQGFDGGDTGVRSLFDDTHMAKMLQAVCAVDLDTLARQHLELPNIGSYKLARAVIMRVLFFWSVL